MSASTSAAPVTVDGAVATRVARHWIDGEWSGAGEQRESIDPATGGIIGTYSEAGAAEVQRAIAAAERAFADRRWATDRYLRARVLNRMADRLAKRTADLIDITALDVGKIKQQAAFEVGVAPETLRFNAALALTDGGRANQVSDGQLGIVVRQPVGVAGIIAPWNAPVALPIRSLAPALAAGCTTVMSLPGQTAQVNALLAEILGQVEELPPGVVNVVTGGPVTGDALVRSPDVPVISFTGSTAIGKVISVNASTHLKRVGLELGGKTPMIVFDDADLDSALSTVVQALIVFAGQFCMTGSRLLVHDSVADRVRTELGARLEAVRVGPASNPRSEMGPIIDKPNVERIDNVVQNAIAQGAKVVVRGGPITEGPLAAGAFYRPVLLEVEDGSLPIVQEETFGPVLTMQRFRMEAEAVAMANNSKYGLGASVFSRDVDRPMRVALALEAGLVWINDWAKLHDQFEEGGYKASGVGRMRGLAVMDDFVEHKYIHLAPGCGTPVASPARVES